MKKLALLLTFLLTCIAISASNLGEDLRVSTPIPVPAPEFLNYPAEQGPDNANNPTPSPERSKSYSRFNIDAGVMCMTGAMSDATFQETGIRARSGFMVGGDLCHMFTPYFGIGVKINYRNLSNTMYASTEKFTAHYLFAGPQILLRAPNRTNTSGIICGFSMGYAATSQKAGFFTFSADTFGAVLDFGYEFGVSDNSAVQLKLSMIAASSKINDELRESMSSVNLTLGVVFGR